MASLDRRDFCTLSGGALLGLAQRSLAQAAQVRAEHTLVLFREDCVASRRFADAMVAQGLQTRALEPDLVRQWRRELGRLLDQGWTLAGHSGWDDWFLLRGLAAEQRHFPLLEQHASPNLFHWVLG